MSNLDLILLCTSTPEDLFGGAPQACDSEEDSLFGFDLHSDGDGNRFAVSVVPQTIEASLAKAGLDRSDIDWLLLHQVNQNFIVGPTHGSLL
ncbi:putative beta-ketoacyl-[acyl-carrier-protein] synthase III [Helianthus annuus]|nr:putative beta-ketoacyl-[acyl-carrier-protein] synthase III [Helianthus annuus]